MEIVVNGVDKHTIDWGLLAERDFVEFFNSLKQAMLGPAPYLRGLRLAMCGDLKATAALTDAEADGVIAAICQEAHAFKHWDVDYQLEVTTTR